MEWREIIQISKWTPLSNLIIDFYQLDDDFYKLSDTQYLLSTSYTNNVIINNLDGPFLVAALWATSEGAARRSYLNEIEKDDMINIIPPSELLPYANATTYNSIFNGLNVLNCNTVIEHAVYRIFTDGIFIHRVIESEIASYYFRNSNISDIEIPYSIQWNLK